VIVRRERKRYRLSALRHARNDRYRLETPHMKKPFLTALTFAALTSAVSLASAQDVSNVVINDLEQLHRLYAISGREDEMIGIYHEVLIATQDPMVRSYVYDSLARAQLKPAHTDEAIATLHTSLTEDLAELRKRTPTNLADTN
jgi:hypothetical protein